MPVGGHQNHPYKIIHCDMNAKESNSIALRNPYLSHKIWWHG
jgi:hypothetical protein